MVLLDDGVRIQAVPVADDGTFTFPSVWGRSGVRLSVRCEHRDGTEVTRWDPGGAFEIGWGARIEHDVPVGDASLLVRLVLPDGAPVPAKSSVWVRRAGEWVEERASTGEDGIARFVLLLAGRYRVRGRIRSASAAVDLGTVVLMAGRETVLIRSPR